MQTLVIFYSYTGKAKKLAKETADKEQADIIELKYIRRPSVFGAYLMGSMAARQQKQAKLQPYNEDFSSYDKIIIVMPVWAQFPAPAFNNIIDKLPEGKKVEIIMTSGSGNSGSIKEDAKKILSEKKCELVGFRDVKSGEMS